MLTAASVSKAKPKEKEYVLFDSDHLFIRIRPNGSRTWFVRYSLTGKTRKKFIGEYPAVTLAQARQKRDALIAEIKTGGLTDGPDKTFGGVINEWYDRKKKRLAAGTAKNMRRRIEMHLLPELGNKLIKDIQRPQLVRLVSAIADSGREQMARTICGILENSFRYALDLGLIQFSPAQYLASSLPSRLKAVQHRKAATSDSDIAAVMQGIASIKNQQTRLLLNLIAYTFVRVKEAIRAEWCEVDFKKKIWVIPQNRMKMRRELVVPLSRQVLELFEKAKAYDEIFTPKNPFIFSSTVPPKRGVYTHLSDSTALRSLIRLYYEKKIPRVTVHGFRTTASTTLNNAGWNPDAIERQLAHVSSGVREIYNRAEYLDIRAKLMQWYADYLDALRDGTPLPKKPQKK